MKIRLYKRKHKTFLTVLKEIALGISQIDIEFRTRFIDAHLAGIEHALQELVRLQKPAPTLNPPNKPIFLPAGTAVVQYNFSVPPLTVQEAGFYVASVSSDGVTILEPAADPAYASAAKLLKGRPSLVPLVPLDSQSTTR